MHARLSFLSRSVCPQADISFTAQMIFRGALPGAAPRVMRYPWKVLTFRLKLFGRGCGAARLASVLSLEAVNALSRLESLMRFNGDGKETFF